MLTAIPLIFYALIKSHCVGDSPCLFYIYTHCMLGLISNYKLGDKSLTTKQRQIKDAIWMVY